MAVSIKGDIQYRIGGDNTGLIKALADTQKQLKAFEKSAGVQTALSISTGFTAAAGSAIGLATAMVGATTAMAETVRESSNLARQTGLSVSAYQSLDFAAKQYGVTGEQVADITKDIRDKAQEFARDATGPFADLQAQLGLTSEQAESLANTMVDASGPQSIGLMISKMEELGLTANQQTQALESMGNDLSRLQPLFADNSRELNRFTSLFNAVTVPVDEEDVQAFTRLASAVDLFEASISNLFQKQSGFANWLAEVTENAAFFWASLNEGSSAQITSRIAEISAEIRELNNEIKNNDSVSGRLINVATLTSTDSDVLRKQIQDLREEEKKLRADLNELQGSRLPTASEVSASQAEKPVKPKSIPKPLSETEKENLEARKKAANDQYEILVNSANKESTALANRKLVWEKYYNDDLISKEQRDRAIERLDENHSTAMQEAATAYAEQFVTNSPAEQMRKDLEALDLAYSEGLEKDQAYYDAKKAIEEGYRSDVEQSRTEFQDGIASASVPIFQSLGASPEDADAAAGAVKQGFKDLESLQSSHSKRAQAIGKAAAITNATIATYQSATQAYSAMAGIPIVGPALGIAAAAAAVAAGLSNVQKIRGAKYQGGQISANTSAPYLVGEKGPELFVPNQAGNVVPNDQLGGGGTTNVNISAIDAAGVEQLLLENTDLILGLVREA